MSTSKSIHARNTARAENTAAPSTAALITALQQPGAYPFAVEQVSFLQTHISLLFFAGDRVFKIKKPLDLGFLDYSTLERRKHFCEEEVRLNRRLAADIYIRVAPICCERDCSIRIDGSGDIIEYAVEMVRLPEEQMLSRRLERSDINRERLDQLAAMLAQFHQEAATGPGVDEYASPDELRRQIEENFHELLQQMGDQPHAQQSMATPLSQRLFLHLKQSLLGFVESHHALLEQRMRDGRVREGHGDLHTGNICVMDDRIVVYDCIEFSPRFRCRDVACEMAFLAMDLDDRGHRELGRYLLQTYASLARDRQMHRLTNFYKLHLAIVRGKVASIKANDGGVGEAERVEACCEAMRYFHLAAGYTLGPALVLTTGLPASGKSHAAAQLAQPLNALVLRSDVLRKQLAGMSPTQRAQGDAAAKLYSPQFTERTYRKMLEKTRSALQAGRVVIVDATFPSAAMRMPFLELAMQQRVPHAIVHAVCSDEETRRRMAQRARDHHEVSDADWQVYLDAKQRYQAPVEWPDDLRIEHHANQSAEQLAARVIDALIAQATPAIRPDEDATADPG